MALPPCGTPIPPTAIWDDCFSSELGYNRTRPDNGKIRDVLCTIFALTFFGPSGRTWGWRKLVAMQTEIDPTREALLLRHKTGLENHSTIGVIFRKAILAQPIVKDLTSDYIKKKNIETHGVTKMKNVFEASIYTMGRNYEIDFMTECEAVQFVEIFGSGSIVQFRREYNLPGCFPKIVCKSISLQVCNNGNWTSPNIHTM